MANASRFRADGRCFALPLLLALLSSLAQPAAAQTSPPQTTKASTPTSAQPTLAPRPTNGCRVVVLNLVGRNLAGVDADVPVMLTDSLAAEVAAVSGCQVVSQGDITQMIDFEAQKAACGDETDSCLAEIGAALGAERVVGGTLGRLGGDFILSARLMNLGKGVVESRAEQVVHGAIEDLRQAARNAARQLFGVAPAAVVAPPPPPSAAAPNAALWWTGVVTGGVGLLALAGGGVVAGVAETGLATAAQADKDQLATEGQQALVVAAVGVVVAVVGGGLVVAALVME